jgi:hypothetical protein
MKLGAVSSYTMTLQRKYLRGGVDEIHTLVRDGFLVIETHGTAAGWKWSGRRFQDRVLGERGWAMPLIPSLIGCAKHAARIPVV